MQLYLFIQDLHGIAPFLLYFLLYYQITSCFHEDKGVGKIFTFMTSLLFLVANDIGLHLLNVIILYILLLTHRFGA